MRKTIEQIAKEAANTIGFDAWPEQICKHAIRTFLKARPELAAMEHAAKPDTSPTTTPGRPYKHTQWLAWMPCQGMEEPEKIIPELIKLIREVVPMAEEGKRNCEADASDRVAGAKAQLREYNKTLKRIYAVIKKLEGVQE